MLSFRYFKSSPNFTSQTYFPISKYLLNSSVLISWQLELTQATKKILKIHICAFE